MKNHIERQAKRVKSGFTLIELLVVIAIIAILAAILFPVFGRARENARRSSCQSNLKQLGLGMMQYTQDYDEYLPCGTQGTSASMGGGWSGQIFPYVKSAQIFACPNEQGRPNVAAPAGTTYYSYRYNLGILRELNNAAGQTFANMKKISAFNATSKTIMLYEGGSYAFTMTDTENQSAIGNGREVDTNGWGVPAGTLMFPQAGWINGQSPKATSRHLEGSNYLAVDGHVKWFRPESISYGFRANSETSAAVLDGGSGTLFAEGTAYSGADAHALTMSYR